MASNDDDNDNLIITVIILSYNCKVEQVTKLHNLGKFS